MQLAEALALPAAGGAVSLVGGGGKTSLMLRLARELSRDGTRVVVTTTTHIMAPTPDEAGLLLTDGRTDTLRTALLSHPLVCAACPAPDGKLSAPPGALLAFAARHAGWLLAEADGARRLPVKAPAEKEPQLLAHSRAVIAVAGLTALGEPLGRVCHRPELACSLLGVPPEALLTPELLARLLTSERGQFKQVGNVSRFRVLLNQADDEHLTALGEETARHILRLLPGCRAAVAALRQESCIKGVYPCSF